jgi:glucose/arabinose dehydrogenase
MGLLGLAFHPRFGENRFFFVNYTADNPLRTVVSRFEADPADPDRALASSEKIILEFSQPYRNHNGGQIGFGPDGYLYVATGDGGARGDPHGNAQSLGTLLGKILRIDVDRSEEGRAYAVPDDNPFRGRDRARGEIWAYGLRNPWCFSWDGQGRLWAADVGQDAVEEIDIVEKGKNYGWNILEGSRCFKPPSGCDPAGTVLPVDEYTHELGQSVTGGFVYAGKAVPSLEGAYVFADFVSGRVWTLWYDKFEARRTELLRNEQAMISSFGIDETRELYLCSFDGGIYRLKQTAAPA